MANDKSEEDDDYEEDDDSFSDEEDELSDEEYEEIQQDMYNPVPPETECRMWVNFPKEYNCCLISIYENGCMTLREVGERLGISFARVKQIEEKALNKIRRWEGIKQ